MLQHHCHRRQLLDPVHQAQPRGPAARQNLDNHRPTSVCGRRNQLLHNRLRVISRPDILLTRSLHGQRRHELRARSVVVIMIVFHGWMFLVCPATGKHSRPQTVQFVC
jgi:hypothetical protein